MYKIDYNTGITDVCESTLADAKAMADAGAAYTQCDITIEDENGEEVARRKWWGVALAPDDAEGGEITFGDFGFFGPWN